jgi:tripartite-type tricarboxylate transporter receptor subunit TctC
MDRPPNGVGGSRRAILKNGALAVAAVGVPWQAGLAASALSASHWPSRPLRMLVGFPGGSSPDLTARALAEPLSQALGQPVIVDNRPGASGNLAADIVAKATDGHTLGLMINGNLTIARLLNPRTPYDPASDLAPVCLIGTAPLVLTVAPGVTDAPQSFVKSGLQAGATWNYGSPGQGTVAHLCMELLKARTGLAPVHIPYPGNPQVVHALLSGQIHLALLPPGVAMPQVRAGKLRAIGVTSPGRSTLAPEFPALAELGIQGFDLEVWNAVAVPASLGAAAKSRLASVISEIVRAPAMRERLFLQGWQVVGSSPEGLANRMRRDTAQLGDVIARQKIRIE